MPDKLFNPGHIHSFRLEVKKIQAFFQLLSVEMRDIHYPKQLKKIYKILGKIRLIQLQQEFLHETAKGFHIKLPVHYLAQLENDKKKLKKSAEYRIKNMKALKAGKLNNEVPDNIGAGLVQKYFSIQENTLKDSLAIINPDETSLHMTRKILKKMLYNMQYLKKGNKPADFIYRRQNLMKSMESEIGSFHDISLSLQLLEDAIRKGQSGIEETETLTSIRDQWQKDKSIVRKQIDHSGHLLISAL
jgi:CHAD domain-containing protein